jgi:hypothetical protein
MFRRRSPFELTKNGYRCNLDADEMRLIQRLVGEVRELLTTTPPDDPKMQRLFPPAYDRAEDSEADTDYRRLMREELVASRLESLSVIDELFGEPEQSDPDSRDTRSRKASSVSSLSMTEDQLHAIAKSLNSVRLILGTLLGLSDDDGDGDGQMPIVDESSMALYHYLSWLLESAIDAMMRGFD